MFKPVASLAKSFMWNGKKADNCFVTGKSILLLLISFFAISYFLNHSCAGQDVSGDDDISVETIAPFKQASTPNLKDVSRHIHMNQKLLEPFIDVESVSAHQHKTKKADIKASAESRSTITNAIITVPGDYPTIQEAINVAVDGDTVLVSSGTYHETLAIIDKDITLQGVNKETTIINGENTENLDAIDVKSGKVNISGFTVESGRVGIFVNFSDGSVIINNTIRKSNLRGLNCQNSTNLIIKDNLVEANSGLGLVVIDGSGHIESNIIKSNKLHGIECSFSPNLTIANNLIEANYVGLLIASSSGGLINVTNNTIKHNNGQGLHCQNSSNVYVIGNSIETNYQGIQFLISFSSSFIGNTIAENINSGMVLGASASMKVSENHFTHNGYHGIVVYICNDVEITKNEITRSASVGIYVEDASALITDNTIKSSINDGFYTRGVNSIVEMIDNMIADSTRIGIGCANGALITGCCNKVINNGTNYSGCSASLEACPCPVGMAGDSLSITPSSVLLTWLGTNAQLGAILTGKNGATLNVANKAAWSSLDSSIVVVDNKGLVTSIGAGDTEICAGYNSIQTCIKATVNTLYAGINQWTQSYEGRAAGLINAIVIDPISNNTIYAATQGGKIFKSLDNGNGWQQKSNGLGGDSETALAISSSNHLVIYAGASQSIYKSIDGGENWGRIKDLDKVVYNIVIDYLNTETIYVGGSFGMLKSTNGGASFALINKGLTDMEVGRNSLVMDALSPEILYVIAGSKLFKTTNGGYSWHEIGSGLPGTTLCLDIDPHNPKVLFVGTAGDGIYKTTDAGNTWHKLTGSPIEINRVIKVDPINPSVLYVGNEGGGVYESRDGGTSWREFSTQLTNHTIWALACSQKYPTLFAGSSMGIFRYKHAFEEITSKPNDDGISIDIAYQFNRDTGIEPLGFNIYRSTSALGDFEKITKTPLAPTVTSFHDQDFLDGATHVYKMTVVDAKGETLPSFTTAAKPLHDSNPDYAINAAEAEKSVTQGGGVVFPLTISSHDNFDENVTFDATGLPAGVTASFSPTDGVPPLAVAMNVTTTITTLPGSYDITVKAKGDTVTRTETVRLTVGAEENKITQRINADTTDVTVGKELEITGKVTPVKAGEQVRTAFVSPDNTSSSKTTITDAGGKYSIVKAFEKSGVWKITTTWEGGNTSSQTDELFVAQTAISIVMATDASPNTKIGDTLTLKGKISPNPGEGEIFLEIDNLDGSIQFSGLVTVSSEGEFSHEVKVLGATSGDIRIYAQFYSTSEYGPSERTIFVPINKPLGMAIIVAGGGSAQSNKRWGATNTICNYVYTVIKNQGVPDDLSKEGKNRIWYLHPNAKNDADGDGTADTDAMPTRANLQKAIQEWARGLVEVGKDAKKTVTPITLYLMGPGEGDKFMINKKETVTAKDLSDWLNQLFSNVKRKLKIDVLPVNVIVESPQSGSFINDLIVKDGVGNGRVVVTATDDGTNGTGGEINVMGDGAVSFSMQFFYGVKSGRSIGTAWSDANLTIQELFDNQNPQIDANGNGIPNEAEDELMGRLAFINQNVAPKDEGKTGTFASGRNISAGVQDAQSFVINQRPIITGAQKNLTVEKQTATLWAKVSDADDAIADLKVQGLLFPPKGKEPVALQLAYSDENDRFEISTDSFNLFGLYTALFVAKDKQGNASRIGKTAVNSQSIFPSILKGVVSNSVTKLPIDGAVVTIDGGYGNVTTTNGGLYLIQLPAGVYTISAKMKKYADGHFENITVSGLSTTKNIELKPKKRN